jgi:hypothetical protein
MKATALAIMPVLLAAACDRVVVSGGEGLVLDLSAGRPVSSAHVEVFLVEKDISGSRGQPGSPTIQLAAETNGRFTVPTKRRLSMSGWFSHGDPFAPVQLLRVRWGAKEAVQSLPGLPGWLALFLFPSDTAPFSIHADRSTLGPMDRECLDKAKALLWGTDWRGWSGAPQNGLALRHFFEKIADAARLAGGTAEIMCLLFDRRSRLSETSVLEVALGTSCEIGLSVHDARGVPLRGVELTDSELSQCAAMKSVPIVPAAH